MVSIADKTAGITRHSIQFHRAYGKNAFKLALKCLKTDFQWLMYLCGELIINSGNNSALQSDTPARPCKFQNTNPNQTMIQI